MPILVVIQEGVNLREYPLTGGAYTIGRSPDSDIFLDDQTVSSRHAEVTLADQPAVVDLGSTNGTYVNGIKVSKHSLVHGDVVRIGLFDLKYVDERKQDFAATVILQPGAGGKG